jgi:hypothetical protein
MFLDEALQLDLQASRKDGAPPIRFRQLGDVGAGVLQRDELPSARQRYRMVEWPFPASCFTRRDARAPA